MVGLKNVAGIRMIVDFISASAKRNRKPDLLVLLGKTEGYEGASPGKLNRFSRLIY